MKEISNDKLLSQVLPLVLDRDLILTALIICYRGGCSPDATIELLAECGVSRDEIRNAFERLVAHYVGKN